MNSFDPQKKGSLLLRGYKLDCSVNTKAPDTKCRQIESQTRVKNAKQRRLLAIDHIVDVSIHKNGDKIGPIDSFF